MEFSNEMTANQIIAFAASQCELPWQWGIFLNKQETEAFAVENRLKLAWFVPIRPGDIYLARRNTGYHLLSCDRLGEACIHAKENAYPFDFSECVKVLEG